MSKSMIFYSLSAVSDHDVVYLSQTERSVKCKLQLWTMYFGSKTVYTDRTLIKLPVDMVVVSGCWTSSGWFVFCDSSMDVYRIRAGAPNPEICVKYIEDNLKSSCALISTSKLGFVLYTVYNMTVS